MERGRKRQGLVPDFLIVIEKERSEAVGASRVEIYMLLPYLLLIGVLTRAVDKRAGMLRLWGWTGHLVELLRQSPEEA